jgi:TRAP-type C4-dicarboxylate transport system permease small subunit
LAAALAASLFAMMALVSIDVLGRYVFNAPIRGAFEIMQCLMALVVFTGMPLVTESREHIAVGLLDAVGGPRFALLRGFFNNAVSTAVTGFIAMRLWDQGASMAKSGTVIGLVAIPVAPFAYFMSLMSGVTAAAFLAHALGMLLSRR